MPNKPYPLWWAYVVAVLATAAASAIGAALGKAFDTSVLFATYFVAVAFSSWYGGIGPGLFCTVMTYIAACVFFLPPTDRFVVNSTSIAFLFVCAAIAVFSEGMKRAMRRARVNADQVVSIVEHITDYFVVLDDRLHVTYMNLAAAEFSRRYFPTSVGAAQADFLRLAFGASVEARLRQAAVQRATVDLETFQEGWKRWFAIEASPAATGGLAIYFRDITEHKLAGDELRRLASIVESSQDAVIGTDLEGKIVSWNPAAERLYGYASDEALGQPDSLLVPTDRADVDSEILVKLIDGKTICNYDTLHVAKDGRRIHVSLSASPINDAAGNIIGAAMIARDITDRVRAEEALLEADRRKDDFLALLGHELRNPLAAIANGIHVLNHMGSTNPDFAEIHAIIERQAGHMSRLMDDLLDVSRIARGKVNLRTERLNLAALVRRTAEDHRPILDRNALLLEVKTPATPLWIDGDAVRIAQVLDNLLNNSIKFSDKGGRIVVEALVGQDGFAVVRVRDTGIGITSDTIASLFEPFSQAEGTLGRSRGGLGLGLALVKGLVELHRGSVSAESEGPGRGSVFTLRLPLATAGDVKRPAPPQDVHKQRHRRVLIVEDNPDVSASMSKLLSVHGHSTAVAADGQSGLEMARQFRPDIVLCDIGLPGSVDGYGVARALRADSSMSSTYLVAVTGFGLDVDRRRAAEAGFDRHMTKPVDDVRLLALLTDVTTGRPGD